jgi:hypothetical protein
MNQAVDRAASRSAEGTPALSAADRIGPIGRLARLMIAVGFAYSLGTLVDQGGPASIRDASVFSDEPFVVLTVAMAVVYAILVTQLAKLIPEAKLATITRRVTVIVPIAAVIAAAVIGELASGEVWRSPLSDLVWGFDVFMLAQTIAGLLLAVVLGTPGCEIGVWTELAARLRGRPASPPLCVIGLHHLDAWELRRRSDTA